MLLLSHAAELLLVQKNNPARGIIPLSMVLHTHIFCYDFQYTPSRLSLTPLENVLTHLVHRSM